MIKPPFYVARTNAAGESWFEEPQTSLDRAVEGAIESTWLWSTEAGLGLPENIGRPPVAADGLFPGPGATRFGLVCLPPHSAGKLDMSTRLGNVANAAHGDKPGMHRSDTIDYEVIISGRVDIELGSGEVRTLVSGSCLVMGGAMHAWNNRYDEACLYAAIMVGGAGTPQ